MTGRAAKAGSPTWTFLGTVAALALTSAQAVQAQDKDTIGLALTDWGIAGEFEDIRSECPDGTAATNRQNWLALFKTPEEQRRRREPFEVDGGELQRDERPEAKARGVTRQAGERGPRVERARQPADVAHLQVVIRREEPVVAEPLGDPRQREHALVAGTLLGLDEDAQIHGRRRYRSSRRVSLRPGSCAHPRAAPASASIRTST